MSFWLAALVIVVLVVVGCLVGWFMGGWAKQKTLPPPTRFLDDDDPMARAVNRSFNTGEVVVWHEGDELPDPAGPTRKVQDV